MCLTTSLKPLPFASARNEGETSSAIIIANMNVFRTRCNNRVITLPPFLRAGERESVGKVSRSHALRLPRSPALSSIGALAILLRPAEIEREIFRDSELAAQVVDLFGVEWADDVDDHDLLRVGDQHADSFDHGVVVDHQEDLDVLAVALAAHADYAFPAGRGELLANRFDVGVAVLAFFVKLHALDVNALERLDDLFDRGLIRLVAPQKLGRH